jgi:thiol-disulfide isomerase/thioredoxin
MVKSTSGGVAQQTVNLTYYFSQTCPYCARTTPDLAIISNENASKLAFTCVDVTPLGATNGPNESYITSKLPCKWRLPEEGEVEKEGIRQTPTLIIQKTGQSPMRLSGYVPLTQLRTYF